MILVTCFETFEFILEYSCNDEGMENPSYTTKFGFTK